jgi:hypothetical protein
VDPEDDLGGLGEVEEVGDGVDWGLRLSGHLFRLTYNGGVSGIELGGALWCIRGEEKNKLIRNS